MSYFMHYETSKYAKNMHLTQLRRNMQNMQIRNLYLASGCTLGTFLLLYYVQLRQYKKYAFAY